MRLLSFFSESSSLFSEERVQSRLDNSSVIVARFSAYDLISRCNSSLPRGLFSGDLRPAVASPQPLGPLHPTLVTGYCLHVHGVPGGKPLKTPNWQHEGSRVGVAHFPRKKFVRCDRFHSLRVPAFPPTPPRPSVVSPAVMSTVLLPSTDPSSFCFHPTPFPAPSLRPVFLHPLTRHFFSMSDFPLCL